MLRTAFERAGSASQLSQPSTFVPITNATQADNTPSEISNSRDFNLDTIVIMSIIDRHGNQQDRRKAPQTSLTAAEEPQSHDRRAHPPIVGQRAESGLP
ncbi:hypothetical protein LCGC14_2930020 [marine sediment metagenome]|uniref:Uncharacterized protein n=1 Tax=marine sediment metagenome TaxID=412755 RepID=A0A0F8XLK3_9ZZZZ